MYTQKFRISQLIIMISFLPIIVICTSYWKLREKLPKISCCRYTFMHPNTNTHTHTRTPRHTHTYPNTHILPFRICALSIEARVKVPFFGFLVRLGFSQAYTFRILYFYKNRWFCCFIKLFIRRKYQFC